MIDADLERDALDVLRRFTAARAGGPAFSVLMKAFLDAAATAPTTSINAYRSKSKPLLSHFGALPIGAITKQHGKDYVAKRTAGELIDTAGEPFKAAGVNTAWQELGMATAILSRAVEDGALSSNQLALVKPPKKLKKERQASLREEHLPDVVAAAPNLMTAVYIIVCFDTGARRSEAIRIRWDDLDWRAMSITIRHGKGDKERTVCTTSRALEAIRRLPRSLGNPYVFASTSPRCKAKPMGPDQLYRWMIEAVNSSGVERHYAGKKVRIHALRRGHATNAVERGVDLRSVQAQLGHASIVTTEKYIDNRLDHRRREMAEKYARGLEDPLATRRGPQRAGEKTQAKSENSVDNGTGIDEAVNADQS